MTPRAVKDRWVPSLVGPDAELALAAVRRIADELAVRAGGESATAPELAMRAWLFATCADVLRDSGYRELSQHTLEAAVDLANAATLPPALHGGLLTLAV